MKKNFTEIEIPFGVKDSELYQFTYTIPDGYSAEIKDGKVIVKKKESEDERIRKWILDGLDFYSDAIGAPEDHKKAIAYLERQKEYIEDIRQYAYNKGLVDAAERQQPAEWSEEDEMHLNWVIEHFRQSGELYHDLIDWLKSLRSQPHWKPSNEQMDALKDVAYGTYQNGDGPALRNLYEQLKKLI